MFDEVYFPNLRIFNFNLHQVKLVGLCVNIFFFSFEKKKENRALVCHLMLFYQSFGLCCIILGPNPPLSILIGIGNMMVLLCSAAMLFKV